MVEGDRVRFGPCRGGPPMGKNFIRKFSGSSPQRTDKIFLFALETVQDVFFFWMHEFKISVFTLIILFLCQFNLIGPECFFKVILKNPISR